MWGHIVLKEGAMWQTYLSHWAIIGEITAAWSILIVRQPYRRETMIKWFYTYFSDWTSHIIVIFIIIIQNRSSLLLRQAADITTAQVRVSRDLCYKSSGAQPHGAVVPASSWRQHQGLKSESVDFCYGRPCRQIKQRRTLVTTVVSLAFNWANHFWKNSILRDRKT